MFDRRGVLFGMGTAALLPGASIGADASDVIRIPITLATSRIFVDCALQGSAPYRFVLDTGGTIGLINLALAKQLKLSPLGQSRLGIRNAQGLYPIYEARDVVFGGVVRQPSAVFAGIEKFGFGEDAVGSLAAGVLTAVDGELDLGALEWRIYRGGMPDRSGWTAYQNAIVHMGNLNGSAFLFADAAVNGVSFRFGLDTGMPSSIRMYRKSAERAGLWNAPRWAPAAPSGKMRIIRGETLRLADAVIERPLISLVEDSEWKGFDNGLIGLPNLRLFDIATQASTRTLWLKRTAGRSSRRPTTWSACGWTERAATYSSAWWAAAVRRSKRASWRATGSSAATSPRSSAPSRASRATRSR
jgi:hypothetical protein